MFIPKAEEDPNAGAGDVKVVAEEVPLLPNIPEPAVGDVWVAGSADGDAADLPKLNTLDSLFETRVAPEEFPVLKPVV